jgi:hypothetical protein
MMPQVMARKRTSPIPTMAAINPGPRPPSIRQAWPTWGQRQDFENIFGKNGENRNMFLLKIYLYLCRKQKHNTGLRENRHF